MSTIRLSAFHLLCAHLLAALAAAAPNTQDSNVSFLETFALSEDRAATLRDLTPGSEDAAYYRCLDAQNRGAFDEAAELLNANKSRPDRGRWKTLRHRQALLTFPSDPKATWTYLVQALNLDFGHSREAPGAVAQLPHELDPAQLEDAAWERRNRGRSSAKLANLSGLALERQASRDLDDRSRHDLLKRLQRPDLKGLADLIVRDLASPLGKGFGSSTIHRNLLPDQLQRCAELQPSLLDEAEFVATWIRSMAPGEDMDLHGESNPERLARRDYIRRLEDFVQELAPHHNSLKAHVFYRGLEADLQAADLDPGRLLRYLSLPRSGGYGRPEPAHQPNRIIARLDQNFPTGFDAVRRDHLLVQAYFDGIFPSMESPDAFQPCVDPDELRDRFAKAKLLAGSDNPEFWFAQIKGLDARRRFESRVELSFPAHNQRVFGSSEAIALDLDIKNVSQLLVKVYEINTLNWYLTRQAEVPPNIEVDGLVPGFQQEYSLDERPSRRLRRRFVFDQARRPGVYVVEFIGDGMSSRAIVRKGHLDFIERQDSAGHAMHVLDETSRVLTGTSIWLGGIEYQANDQGVIRLPYSTAPGTKPIVLTHGEQAQLASLDHAAESYTLTAGLHVPRESLVPGATASLLVRPGLLINGRPTTPALIDAPTLQVTFTSFDGQAATRLVPLAAIDGRSEIVVPVEVPERWTKLSVHLTGRVQNLSRGETQDLQSAPHTLLGSLIAQSNHIEAPLLAQTPKGYRFDLRGRTGEPLASRAVKVSLKHRDYERSYQLELASDDRGQVTLGHLDGIQTVTVAIETGKPQTWRLPQGGLSDSADRHLLEGQELRLAYLGNRSTMDRTVLSLLERRAGFYVRDAFTHASLEAGAIVLRNLQAGDYELHLKETSQTVRLCVSSGRPVKNWARGHKRLLELEPVPPLCIEDLALRGEDLVLQLSGVRADTRVHVIASRFVPTYDATRGLNHHAPNPLVLETRSIPLSSYEAARAVSSEQRYVLERRYAQKFPGNMLSAKPSLLLNPWEYKDVNATSGIGGGAGGKHGGRFANKRQRGSNRAPLRSPSDPPSGGCFADVAFLPSSATVLANLRPDSQGYLRVPLTKLGDGPHLSVIAVDANGVLNQTLVRDPSPWTPRDLRLSNPLDTQQHFGEQRSIEALNTGDQRTIERSTSSRAEVFGTLSSAMRLLEVLSGSSELKPFAFLADWPSHSPERKAELLSDFACHGLHVFLYQKDRPFFDAVVRPYLQNKHERTFIDDWLLEEEVDSYLEPFAYARLNTLERILLADRIPSQGAGILRGLQDALASRPADPADDARRFERALIAADLERDPGAKRKLQLDPSLRGLSPNSGVPATPSSPNDLSETLADDEALSTKPDDFFLGRGEVEIAARKQIARLWLASGATKAFIEQHYWQVPLTAQVPELIPLNPYWLDLADHLALGSASTEPFVPASVTHATSSLSEMLMALAFLELPFDAPESQIEDGPNQLTLTAASPLLLVRKRLTVAAPKPGPPTILISYDITRNGETQAGELLTLVPYTARVVVTNPGPANQSLEILHQIPEGSLPLGAIHRTRGFPIQASARNSVTLTFPFYFPLAGEFQAYPPHLSHGGQSLAFAPARGLTVVDTPTVVDRESWTYLSQSGSHDEVLDFVSKANLGELKLRQVAWRLNDAAFYTALSTHLWERMHFGSLVDSYALRHEDPQGARNYLSQSTDFVDACGPWLQSELLTIDPFERGLFQEVELAPIIQARAHRFSDDPKIANKALSQQWTKLLEILAHKPEIESSDRLSLTALLILQGRIGEALAHFQRARVDELETRLQYDYMRCYLAFFGSDPESIRPLAASYQDHPVDRWRTRFAEVIAQLDEARGYEPDANNTADPGTTGDFSRVPAFLEMKVQGKRIALQHSGLSELRVNYYPMDIEELFSSSPFLEQSSTSFSFVRPNHSQRLSIAPGATATDFEIASPFEDRNVLVEVRGGNEVVHELIYAGSLSVILDRAAGQLLVTDSNSRRPVRKAYVKVFARDPGGNERFHKDGYTDFRGRFDYASITGSDQRSIDRFAILVLVEGKGARIQEVQAPAQ